MTKEDLIWVVIRATGFLLVLRAVLYAPEIVSSAYWAWYVGPASEGFRMTVDVVRHQLITSVAYVLAYGLVGIYLLRKGAWIYRLISFSTPERSNSTMERDARKGGARPSL